MTLNQLAIHNVAPRGVAGSCVPTSLAFTTGSCYQDIEYVLISEQPELYRPDIKGNNGVDTVRLLGTSRILFGHRFTMVGSRGLRLMDLKESFPTGTYLVRVQSHLLVLKEGEIYDLANKKPKTEVLTMWKVEKHS